MPPVRGGRQPAQSPRRRPTRAAPPPPGTRRRRHLLTTVRACPRLDSHGGARVSGPPLRAAADRPPKAPSPPPAGSHAVRPLPAGWPGRHSPQTCRTPPPAGWSRKKAQKSPQGASAVAARVGAPPVKVGWEPVTGHRSPPSTSRRADRSMLLAQHGRHASSRHPPAAAPGSAPRRWAVAASAAAQARRPPESARGQRGRGAGPKAHLWQVGRVDAPHAAGSWGDAAIRQAQPRRKVHEADALQSSPRRGRLKRAWNQGLQRSAPAAASATASGTPSGRGGPRHGSWTTGRRRRAARDRSGREAGGSPAISVMSATRSSTSDRARAISRSVELKI